VLEGTRWSLAATFYSLPAGLIRPRAPRSCWRHTAAGHDVRLLVGGDSSQVPAYERMLHELADRGGLMPCGNGKRCCWAWSESARLFVFPSTVEALSMMLLEAASTGAPIVCSEHTENVAVLAQQTLLFRSGDAQDLREKLEWALGPPGTDAGTGGQSGLSGWARSTSGIRS